MPIAAHIRWSCGKSCIPGAHTRWITVRSGSWDSNVRPPSLGRRVAPTSAGCAIARVNVSRIARRGSVSPSAARQSVRNSSTSNMHPRYSVFARGRLDGTPGRQIATQHLLELGDVVGKVLVELAPLFVGQRGDPVDVESRALGIAEPHLFE